MDDPVFDYKWVEILDYEQQCPIYLNVITAETRDTLPSGDKVLGLSEEYWLEILCNRTGRLYYYNSQSHETTWDRPTVGLIVPLARVQMIHHQQQQLSQAASSQHGIPFMGGHQAPLPTASSTSSSSNSRANRPLPPLNPSESSTSQGNASPRLLPAKDHNAATKKKKKSEQPSGRGGPLPNPNSVSNKSTTNNVTNQNAPPSRGSTSVTSHPHSTAESNAAVSSSLIGEKSNSNLDLGVGESNGAGGGGSIRTQVPGSSSVAAGNSSAAPCSLPSTVFDLVPPLNSLSLGGSSSTAPPPPSSYANIDIIQRQQQQLMQQTKSGSSIACSSSQNYSTGASIDSGLPAENTNSWDSLEKLPAVRKPRSSTATSKGSSNSPLPQSVLNPSSSASACSPLYVNASQFSSGECPPPLSSSTQPMQGLVSSATSANVGLPPATTVTPNAKHRSFPRTNPIHRRGPGSERSPLSGLGPPDGEESGSGVGPGSDMGSVKNGSLASGQPHLGPSSADMNLSMGGTLASTGSGTGSASGSGSAQGSASALFSTGGSGKGSLMQQQQHLQGYEGGPPCNMDSGGGRPMSLYVAAPQQQMMLHPQAMMFSPQAALISPGAAATAGFPQYFPQPMPGMAAPYFTNWSNTMAHPYSAAGVPAYGAIPGGYPGYPTMFVGNPATGGVPVMATTATMATATMPPTVSMSGLPIRPGWDPSLFRKGADIGKLLTWQKESIHKPLLENTDKAVKKDAPQIFKLIQMYMGDRKSKYPPGELLQSVVQSGKTQVALRDEIFMQLCKQTTSNSDEMSTIRGWEMICACVQFFPPSEYFCPYVVGYMERHLRAARGIGLGGTEECPTSAAVLKLARVAISRLQRGLLYGTMSAWLRQTPVTLAEVQTAVNSIHNPRMFGSSLDEVMAMQAERFPERQLPWILTTLVAEIFLQNGHRTEGIFRVPANQQSVSELRERCERWNTQLPCPEPHTPATLLKLWLQELAEPLIPVNVTPYVMQLALASITARRQATHATMGSGISGSTGTGANAGDGHGTMPPTPAYLPASALLDEWDDNVVDQALILVQVNPEGPQVMGPPIPYINRLCLAYLVWFVQILTQEENQAANRMTSYTLSMLLAPNLFSPVESQAFVLQACELQTEFLQLLVENWDVADIAPILA